MKRLLTYFGIVIVLAQSALCVPIPVDEPAVDPTLRGFIELILSAIPQPILNGLASTGNEIIASAMNSGGNLLSSLMARPHSNAEVVLNSNPEFDSQYMNVPEDDQLLDLLDALVHQMIVDQLIVTTEAEPETIENDEEVSNDEIGEDPDRPLYLVLLP